MISLLQLTQELCRLIKTKTGTEAVPDGTMVKGQDAYVVSCGEEELFLIDGGRQVERTIGLSIGCYSASLLQEQSSLSQRLLSCLLPYVSLCGRHLLLQDCKITNHADKEQVSAKLFFCDDFTLPEGKLPHMEHIRFDFTQQEDF